jgi:hypothetical protein
VMPTEDYTEEDATNTIQRTASALPGDGCDLDCEEGAAPTNMKDLARGASSSSCDITIRTHVVW